MSSIALRDLGQEPLSSQCWVAAILLPLVPVDRRKRIPLGREIIHKTFTNRDAELVPMIGEGKAGVG